MAAVAVAAVLSKAPIAVPVAVPAAAAAAAGVAVRVAVLAIASPGEGYDALKAVAEHHWLAAPDGVELRFLHGRSARACLESPLDERYDDVPETLVPGALRKTLAAFGRRVGVGVDIGDTGSPWPSSPERPSPSRPSPDYVVRTNLSTWFHWDRLLAFLADAPRRGFAAGCSEDRSHLCGACVVLSADVAAALLADDRLRTDERLDDVAMSDAIARAGARVAWVPRIDVLGCGASGAPGGVVGHGDDPLAGAFHVRVKSADGGDDDSRKGDAAFALGLAEAYARGEREMPALLHAGATRVGLHVTRRG